MTDVLEYSTVAVSNDASEGSGTLGYGRAAARLYRYLIASHWREDGLIGPDPGIRFNYRLGRFLKSYLPRVSWRDDYYYLQAQGYWVLASWQLASSPDDAFGRIAIDCSRQILKRQRPDGAWDYPHVEWQGRIATVEGIWASLGLLATYRQTGDAAFLDSALRWHRFLVDRIGFEEVGAGQAVRYFADARGTAVPNNSACAIRFLAELAASTGDLSYRAPCAGMLAFLGNVQTAGGELPYVVESATGLETRPRHFQCFQYNAFQCLDLLRYRDLTGDQRTDPLLRRLLAFLRGAIADDGHVHYSCSDRIGAVAYHAAVVGSALLRAGPFAEPGDDEHGHRALGYVLRLQRPDGSLPHSRGDYRVLRDERRYPRYLAMIAHHLMLASPAVSTGEASPPDTDC